MKWILHIGTGKTGTSSIQKMAGTLHDPLLSARTKYLGLNFDHLDDDLNSFLKTKKISSISNNSDISSSKFLKEVVRISDHYESRGVEQILWSNEALWNMIGLTESLIKTLKEHGCDVVVVFYLRRHGAWLKSAYSQWSLKHKTYKGRLLSFAKWLDTSVARQFQYMSRINILRKLDVELLPGNYDATDDIVHDFYHRIGLSNFYREAARFNESLSPTEVYLYALFNNAFDSPVIPRKFQLFMREHKVSPEFIKNSEWESLFDGDSVLDRLDREIKSDLASVNEFLKGYGVQTMSHDASVPDTIVPVRSKVDAFLMALLVAQSNRIAKLEEALVSGDPKRGQVV